MKPDLAELQEITNCIFDAEHECKENALPKNFRILRCVSIEEMPQNSWQFHSFSFATMETVNAGEASSVGEVVNSSAFQLIFCPFCGTKLNLVSDSE